MEAGVGGSLRILDTIRGNDQLTSIGDPLWFRSSHLVGGEILARGRTIMERAENGLFVFYFFFEWKSTEILC